MTYNNVSGKHLLP